MARKPGLGKGLGALIPEGSPSEEANVVPESGGPLRMLLVTSIRPNPFQPRKSFTDESWRLRCENSECFSRSSCVQWRGSLNCSN